MPSPLRVELQLRIVSDDDTVIRDEVILQLDKSDDRLETVGLCLKDSKDLLGRLQHAVVEAQAAAYVDRHRGCSACGRRLRGKGQYPIVFRTAFGHVPLASPRFYRCRCHPADSQTFSPLAACCMDVGECRRRAVHFNPPDLPVMPHKYNADRRHHIPRPKRRVTNWSEYNEALRQRGSLTVWFTDDAIAAWKAAPRTTPGGQPHYSDLAITTALTLRAVGRGQKPRHDF